MVECYATKSGWSLDDQKAAHAEGWGIFRVKFADGTYGFALQRLNVSSQFGSHQDAIAHAKRRATAGSDVHRRALSFVGLA